jgi:predicted MFS family arabinose efflux permease
VGAAGGRRTRWDIVLVAVAAGVFVAFQTGKLPAALPDLRRDLGLSAIEAGLAVSLLNAVTCVLGLAAGAFADLVGARRIIAGGLVATALASLAGGFAESGPMLLATRALEGLGAIAVFVSGPVMVLRAIDPAHSRLALGIWSGYMPAGTAFMVLVSPLLLDAHGWRGLWWATAAALLVFAAVFLLATRAKRDPPLWQGNRLNRLASDARQVARTRGPWLLALCFATYTANFLSVSSFLPSFLVEVAGHSLGGAAALTALIILGNVFGNVLGGWLLQLGFKRWQLIAFASLIMGASAFFIYRAATPEALRIALGLGFSFFGGLLPASIFGGVAAHAPAPTLIATTNGLVMQVSNIGMLAAPPAFAAIAATQGWSAAPLLSAALGAAGLALALLIRRHEARRWRS